MKHLTLFFSLLLVPSLVAAACPQGDRLAREKGMAAALQAYEQCALMYNDDSSMMKLAEAYGGAQGVPKNEEKMLLFYQLSAETGNAVSQTALAKIMLKMDETADGRSRLQAYMKKAEQQMASLGSQGKMLHPYTYLLLASERADQKWYYPTDITSSPEAERLLNNYAISPEKRAEALKEATAWKNRKMLEAAKKVYNATMYQDFYNTIYPKEKGANEETRRLVIERLRQKVTEVRAKG